MPSLIQRMLERQGCELGPPNPDQTWELWNSHTVLQDSKTKESAGIQEFRGIARNPQFDNSDFLFWLGPAGMLPKRNTLRIRVT